MEKWRTWRGECRVRGNLELSAGVDPLGKLGIRIGI